MVLDGEPFTIMSSPERLSVTTMFECMTFKIPKVPFLTIFDLLVTLTLNLFNLKI